MTIREIREQQERELLSPYAAKSAESKGRTTNADKCHLRTEFQKDRDRITHSKAFRRLMHKTQVFISPEGDHYRTRLTHTIEVAQISRTVARALNLNEDLTEAIALGHDLGHTPFGHTGEDALNKLVPGGFRHNEQSVRVLSVIEHEGEGLNLTHEVLDGVLNHRTANSPATLEGQVVQICDKVAYMNHDIDDAIRAKMLQTHDIPSEVLTALGETSVSRIDFLVRNLVATSINKDHVALSPDVAQILRNLRAFLFENVYANQLHRYERDKIQHMLQLLFEHYMQYPEKLPPEMRGRFDSAKEQTVADYIACMTDRFAMKRFRSIFMPAAWEV